MTGKWLFSRAPIWIVGCWPAWPDRTACRAGGATAPSSEEATTIRWNGPCANPAPGWPSLPEGTARGVERLLRGEVIAAAVHFHSDTVDDDATPTSPRCARWPGLHDAVLVGLARREQGLLLPPGNPKHLHSLADVLGSGAQIAVRQPGAGAQMLLDVLLARAGAKSQGFASASSAPCLTGPDLAAAIRAGRADCGIATRAAAKSAGLDFVPLLWENFDLLMRQRSYFRPAIQALDRLHRPEKRLQAAGGGTRWLRPGAGRPHPVCRLIR